MRRSIGLAAAVFLILTVTACGSSGTTHATDTTSATTTSGQASAPVPSGYSKDDGDKDFDDAAKYHGSPPNDDQELLAAYGHKASPAVTRTVANLVKRYYAVSAAGDGAAACSMLTANLAGEVLAGRNQPGGATCAAAMSKLLAQQHQRLLGENVQSMIVTQVHDNGTLGIAVVRFKAAPESEIVLEHEGQAWKINALFGNEMT